MLAGIGGIRSNAELKQAQNNSSLLSPSSLLAYGNSVAALAPEVAAANSPTGRESPAMVSQAEAALPSRLTPNVVANKYFDTNRQKYFERVRSDIDSYKREGYDVSGLENQLQDAMNTTGGTAPAAQATVQPGTVKVVNGQRFEKLADGRWVAH